MNFTEAICMAHTKLLREIPENYVIGLGVSYQNGADGSTKGLGDLYPKRVLDVPVSELAFTGMAVGMGSQGLRPIVHHGRIEFALLALDQILTQASRWNYMFGGDYPCSVVFRICIGRQWGNGPQHTANYCSIFMQSPGIAVYIPYSPLSAYQQLVHATNQNEPSVYLEHRWLYKTAQEFGPDLDNYKNEYPHGFMYEFSKCPLYIIISYGDGVLEALKAARILKEQNIPINVFAVCYFSGSYRDVDLQEIYVKNARIILFDTSPFEYGLMSGYLSVNTRKAMTKMGMEVYKISPEFKPCPTAIKLTSDYYPRYDSILTLIAKNEDIELEPILDTTFDDMHLPPAYSFKEFEAIKRPVFLKKIQKI